MFTKYKIKYLVVFMCTAILITGCVWPKKARNSDEKTQATKKEISTENIEEKTEVVPVRTGNVITVDKIGFYSPNREASVRELQTGYVGSFTAGKDMTEYSIFYTNEQTISYDAFRTVWESYRNKYENAQKYKIGYEILFTVGNETIKKRILKPSDTESYKKYIVTYLYDDVTQYPNQWYGSLSDKDVTSDTILTAIKLAGGEEVSKVGDEIIITAFIYLDENDFDENTGEYIGTCKKSITFRRK